MIDGDIATSLSYVIESDCCSIHFANDPAFYVVCLPSTWSAWSDAMTVCGLYDIFRQETHTYCADNYQLKGNSSTVCSLYLGFFDGQWHGVLTCL